MESNDLISRKELMEGRVANDPVRIAAMCAHAVDAAPVVHGRWIFKNGKCGCSECRKCLSYDGNGVVLDLSHLPYCPHCGARMDLEE